MRRVLTLLLCICALPLLGGKKKAFEFSAGYHYDVLDYDRAARQFFRHRYRYTDRGREAFLCQTFTEGFSRRYLNWYLALGEERGPFFSGGSFNVRLGSGLLFGPRSYQSGDLLSFREQWSAAVPVRPSSSANPCYAHQGLVAGYRFGSDRRGGGMHTFFSLRRRYISPEDLDEGLIASSPSSLNSYSEGDGSRTEAVYLRTTGVAAEITLGRYLFFQAYGCYSDIADTEGNRLQWQGVGDLSPLEGSAGGGCLLQYRDAALTCLFEFLYGSGLSPGGKGSEGAWAGKGALRFRHRVVDFSVSLITTGKGFYAPESGESLRPFTRGDIFLRYRPLKAFECRGAVNSEIRRVPGGWHRSLPLMVREVLGFAWRPGSWHLEGEVKHARTEDEETEWRRQYRLSAGWQRKDIFQCRVRGVARGKTDAPLSWGMGVDMKGTFSMFLSLSLAWFYCDAAAGNSLYISTGCVPGSVAMATSFDGRGHVCAGAIGKIFFRGRYEISLKGRGVASQHADFSCGGKF